MLLHWMQSGLISCRMQAFSALNSTSATQPRAQMRRCAVPGAERWLSRAHTCFRSSLPKVLTVSSHSAGAPGTVTHSALPGGSSGPPMPLLLTSCSQSAPLCHPQTWIRLPWADTFPSMQQSCNRLPVHLQSQARRRAPAAQHRCDLLGGSLKEETESIASNT